MQKLLVIDDEPGVVYSVKKRFETDALTVLTAGTASSGLNLLEGERPDAVILDVRLPDMSGLDAVDRVRKFDPLLPVVVITAHASTDVAIEAMKRGAFEFLLKPVDFHQLRDVVEKALAASRSRHDPAAINAGESAAANERIVGRSAAMQELFKAIGRIAPQDVTVLLLGESGTGKELVARAIYHYSKRSNGPFLAVNCAALSESLLESELFGHEQGAFTGADRRRIGKFEQVHGGTILLDEIGDMSGATQAKVLRLLQGGEFERVGGHETVRADVRVIAATNRDLEAMVAAGTFRRDLYYRLNGLTIALPPLRERLGDIPYLVEHFVGRLNPQLEKQIKTITPDVLDRLARHYWPGNVRELQNVVRHAMIHALGDTITSDCLPKPFSISAGTVENDTTRDSLDLVPFVRRLLDETKADLYRVVMMEVDRILLHEVLDRVGGNQVQASNILGISRSTLRSKLGLTRSTDPADSFTAEYPGPSA